MHYPNGDYYVGSFKRNLRDGFGTYHYSSTREIYEGEWLNDLWHGRGKYFVVTGEVTINGTWDKGILNGQAEVIHGNGDRFVGTFRNGMKEG